MIRFRPPIRRSARWLVLLVALWALPVFAQPQTPDGEAFFHKGAQSYIDGQFKEAKETVREGLQKHPSDPQLLALRKRLKRKKQRQKQQSKKNQKKKKGGKKKKKQKKSNDSKKGERKKKKQQKNQQQKQPQKGKKKDKKSPAKQPQKKQKPSPQQKKPSAAKRRTSKKISRRQALRILQALGNQEQKLLREVHHPKGARRNVEKDW